MLKRCYNRLVQFLEKRRAFVFLQILHIGKRIWQNPWAAPGKVLRKVRATLEDKRRVHMDSTRSSYGPALPGKPRNLFKLPPLEILRPHAAVYALLAQKTLQHHFDLLGSGWTNLQRGLPRQGVELTDGGGAYPPQEKISYKISLNMLAAGLHKGNQHKAKELWAKIGPGYTPISWNEDFKSGWLWPANTASSLQKYGDKPGADIKVPWELSRMHQLPWLALACNFARMGVEGFYSPQRYAEEFQNQILDFAAACPPRFGANWVCTMDVAIRACNIIAAHDFFCEQDIKFSAGFENELMRILSDHFEHIINHLEYQPKIRANHYYSDLVGLLILSTWLPKTPKVVAALAWSVNEFFKETVLQFQPDGTNFEASTSYHRLCGELMFYALAVIRGFDQETLDALKNVEVSQWRGRGYYEAPPLQAAPEQNEQGVIIPEEVLLRAWLAPDFSLACRMERGELIQIGDNDSGRLFKFLPALAGPEHLEVINDHAHLLAAARGLMEKIDLEEWRGLPDSAIIQRLMGGKGPLLYAGEVKTLKSEGWVSFPSFGLFFKEKGGDTLAVRCGHNGQYDNGGHAHNDQLSIAFARDGRLFLVDPGTYLYTPVPMWRNKMRATCHHNTLFLPDQEQNDFSPISLFTLGNQAAPEVLELSENAFSAQHHGFGPVHKRQISFAGTRIEITDEIAAKNARIALHFHPDVAVSQITDSGCTLNRNGIYLNINILSKNIDGAWGIGEFVYSSGYGLKQPACRLFSPSFKGLLKWEIF